MADYLITSYIIRFKLEITINIVTRKSNSGQRMFLKVNALNSNVLLPDNEYTVKTKANGQQTNRVKFKIQSTEFSM